MDSRQMTELAEHLRGSGLSEQLRDYHRTSVLVVTTGREELLRLRVVTGGGELRVEDAGTPPGAPAAPDTLVVRIDTRAAHTVGVGTSLLEDEFAAGAIALDGARPDDYRQAPVLEALLEGLVRTGALRQADLTGTEAPA